MWISARSLYDTGIVDEYIVWLRLGYGDDVCFYRVSGI
jgi:hypothetical protein